ncbi:MAG: TIGR04076 family protein [Candidatus Nanopelagicales bacterium]|jgi:uncharacterized repeat protein (TIGR04076 family)
MNSLNSDLDPNRPMELYNLRVVVETINGRSVCGMKPGDWFEVTNSAQVRIPEGKHFCMYAIASVLPLLPAKQRVMPENDWLESDSLVACPDPEEQLIMRIVRTELVQLNAADLT